MYNIRTIILSLCSLFKDSCQLLGKRLQKLEKVARDLQFSLEFSCKIEHSLTDNKFSEKIAQKFNPRLMVKELGLRKLTRCVL